jgi:VanZ family protein
MRRIELFGTVAACACVVAIVLLSLIPGAERPRTGMSDFSENFLAYFGTAFLFALGTSSRNGRLLIAPVLLVCSIAMETLQHFIPGRVSWSRLSEQIIRLDKWSLCRG